jgi:CheY-like chemotaxis protein
LEKPRVLIADDNDATCALVAAILRREFDTEIASDGAETIEKLRVLQFSAVLLDLRMPHVDGFAVLQFLHEERPDMLPRTLVLTASLTKAELDRVHAFPVCGIIAKPFEVETLLSAVKRCTASAHDHPTHRGPLLSSGMILLLADLLGHRWIG